MNKILDHNTASHWSATFFNAAQITLSIAIESPLHLKPRLTYKSNKLYDYKLQNEETMRCFKSKENAKRVLLFLLARIDRTEETQTSLYSRYYAEACNEWRGPSPLLSAWATQLRRNFTTVASRW